MYIVAGDLGGTNCRLELLPIPGAKDALAACGVHQKPPPRPRPVHKAKYASGSERSLLLMLQKFLAEPECAAAITGVGSAVVLYSLAVCGPVTNGTSILLAPVFGEAGWRLDASELGLALSSKVIFLNDFHAVGLGLPHIPQAELHTLYAPPPSVGGGGGGGAAPAELEPGVIGCLGPGTGLGEVYAVWNANAAADGAGGSYTVCCSEGGMSDFVARTDEEWLAVRGVPMTSSPQSKQEFRKWLAPQCTKGYVEVEKVVSGEGIANLYKWLRSARPELIKDVALDAEVMAAAEPAAVIGMHCTPGAEGADELSIKAVDLFLSALGAEAANLAIRYQAKGGIYIAGGGVASKLLHRIQDGIVAEAYLGKGHSVACYDGCPLYVATTPGDELGMMGAWSWGLSHLG